jgi:hypothetical protein
MASACHYQFNSQFNYSSQHLSYFLTTSVDANELLNYNKSEERKMEEMMEGIAATGVKAG